MRKKSVLAPTRTITFLGNNIDSEKMLVTLPGEKVCLIVQECRELYKRQYVKIRSVARVLGLMVSTFSAVEFAPFFIGFSSFPLSFLIGYCFWLVSTKYKIR